MYACSLNNRSYSPCSSPHTIVVADGNRGFWVRQTSLSGFSSTADAYFWTIDSRPPNAPRITTRPARFIPAASTTVAWTGEAGILTECALDDAAYSACASPLQLSGLDEGMRTLLIRQTDLAGNVGRVARVTFTVDTIAPPLPTWQSPLPTICGAQRRCGYESAQSGAP